MSLRSDALGDRTPRYSVTPPRATTAGPDAVKLAAAAGLKLDPWQSDVLDGALGERRNGSPAATEVGLILPRQNGKGSCLEALVLHAMFLTPVKTILWTAHQVKTCFEAFQRVRELIDATPALSRRVKSITVSNGKEGITLEDGTRLRFIARSRTSGRGFSPDIVILDEAFELDDQDLSALMPALSAKAENAQIWYVSSAPHETSQVLRRVCKRGRRMVREGITGELAYYEWCAKDEAASNDEEAWLAANPAIGYRLTLDFTKRELDAMDDDDFRRERLGIWIEDLESGREQIISPKLWERLRDPASVASDPVAFAFDVTPDRSFAAIAAAGKHGIKTHIELIDHDLGTGWVVERLVELVGKHQPCVVVVDSMGPAASLLTDLDEAGLKVIDEPKLGTENIIMKTTASSMAQACGAFYDAAGQNRLVHKGDPELDAALASAEKRDLGDRWAWSRKTGGDISPLVAATLAHWGLMLHGRQQPKKKAFAVYG